VSDVLVVSPLGVEALAVRSAAPGLRVRTTGMGPRRALEAVPRLLEDPAVALVVVGFGGGLPAQSRLCEVVVASEVLTIDEHGLPVAEAISCQASDSLASALRDQGVEARDGVVASVEQIIVGEARARMQACGAVAVDMESAWVARAAKGRPFTVVRVLSDTPGRELRRRLPVGPPLPTVADGWRAMSTLRQVGAALGRLKRQDSLHTVLGLSG
jgi:4-hydroxy-3-methylbut-2-enyl diphosphate reductase